jgi:hypothetical protein
MRTPQTASHITRALKIRARFELVAPPAGLERAITWH